MSVLPAYNALTASAKIIPPNQKLTPTYQSWQQQLWDYYDRLGEFESGVSWRSNTMSRVRLLAAELMPGGDEPKPLEEGPAVDAVERLAGGTGGQAQLMKEITIHLSVPGEGWLVGETGDTEEKWFVASADELRVGSRSGRFELREDEENKSWRPLNANSMVVRFWKPHPRFGWRADSDAFHAMNAMLELDLINKRIIAEILSRLASNGVLLYDKQKLSFPPVEQPEGADQVDPFAAILVEVASRGIKDPTSPEATIPIPIGFDMQDLTNVDPSTLLQHVKLAEFLDEKLLTERDSAVKRLATSLDMPSEVLLGMAGLNHWGAWQVEESGIKIHIAPFAELIAFTLTTGYLVPTLKAEGADLIGPNGGKIVIWYDPSEITVRPDRSSNTISAYDRGEAPGRVLRREIGLSEDGDAMTREEFRDWLTRRVALVDPLAAASLLTTLGGPSLDSQPADEPAPGEEQPPVEEGNGTGPPDTIGDEPPNDDRDVASLVSSLNDVQVLELSSALDARLEQLRPRVSAWVEAGVPNDTRVTPERRNGEVLEPAEAP